MGSAALSVSTPLFSAVCFVFCLLFPSPVFSGPVYSYSIPRNFTATYQRFIDNSGAFLASQNNTFQARIANFKQESEDFYFVVVHTLSNEIVWSANRNQAVSRSSQLQFTAVGLALYNESGDSIWSTPLNASSSYLKLLESGNLILLDANNNTLWESFDSPTDVLLEGQKLRPGKSLVSSLNDNSPAEGSYKFVVGVDNAMLKWNGMDYWRLSMYGPAYKDSNLPVEYLMMNASGINLLANNSHRIVIRAPLINSSAVSGDSSIFRMAKLDNSGAFNVIRVNLDRSRTTEFTGPDDSCKIPLKCGKLGLCTNGGSCQQCAPGFRQVNNGGCEPADTSMALPGPCNGSSSGGGDIKYLKLRDDLTYSSNIFTDPTAQGVNLSACQSLCSANCSCLGVFHSQDSGACYMIWNYLGSFSQLATENRVGYVKMVAVVNPIPNPNTVGKKSNVSVLPAILIPSSGAIAIAVVAILIWLKWTRRSRKGDSAKSGIGKYLASAEDETEIISIPGLPVRFTYEEIARATGDFMTQIGSGGFGTVYKGTLVDRTEVAVKKITCLGARGKREFLTEIAVIGKIHHVNLVRLKGFCAHHGQRFLVYEYMNRGSLDRTLFHGDPVLGWRERYEIALGTARGLAYLHSGCENTIIHCDVKPENILLHDKSSVKISDFGLSKLLNTEESGLFTTLRGTRGYLAPEWLTSSVISDKTDVYSYGMVLLEIIRGKKNSSPQTQSNSSGSDNHRGHTNGHMSSSPSSRESGSRPIYFPLFALQMHEERRYLEVVDPRLAGRVTTEEVEKLLRVALCCLHEETNLRPSMSNVVGMLEGGVPLGEPRIRSLNFLRFYGRRFTEASTLAENSNEQNELMMAYRQAVTAATNTSTSNNSLSYISSQQVSGPR